jgi:hypothetical protein
VISSCVSVTNCVHADKNINATNSKGHLNKEFKDFLICSMVALLSPNWDGGAGKKVIRRGPFDVFTINL